MVRELDVDKDGLMHAPTEPGIGGEIDFGLIEGKTEAVLR
jgi:L-alanine-DL-glutamate epimerase-like enolase superfamily enzyme